MPRTYLDAGELDLSVSRDKQRVWDSLGQASGYASRFDDLPQKLCVCVGVGVVFSHLGGYAGA